MNVLGVFGIESDWIVEVVVEYLIGVDNRGRAFASRVREDRTMRRRGVII